MHNIPFFFFYLFDCSSGQDITALISSDGCSVLTLLASFGDGGVAILLSQRNYKCIYTYIHMSQELKYL